MSEECDEADMRALFADAERAPMADADFVGAVMNRIGAAATRTQTYLSSRIWAAGLVAAFLAATNASGLIAELSRAAAILAGDLPSLSGAMATLALVGLGAAGAWLLAERG